MLGRPRNRRKPSAARRWRLPAIPWRALGVLAAVLLLCGGGAAALAWVLDQPIESIAVEGRFQRVAAGDVERVVGRRSRGRGLLAWIWRRSARRIHTLPWVDAAAYSAAGRAD